MSYDLIENNSEDFEGQMISSVTVRGLSLPCLRWSSSSYRIEAKMVSERNTSLEALAHLR
jgi:hypothetical protein